MILLRGHWTIALVNKHMKVTKMTDKIHYSWATVEEYLSNELASDKGNEKRIIQSYNRVEKRAKEAKKKEGLSKSIN